MGILKNLFFGDPLVPDPVQNENLNFAVDAESIPAEIFGYSLTAESVAIPPRIDRKRAMSVPAVKRCRDIVCNSLGSLPLYLYDANGQRLSSSLFEQPEPDMPRSVTMTRTFEDMFFEKRAWWRVIERDWRGWPTSVRRLDARSVQVRKDQKVYVKPDGSSQGTAWEWVQDKDLIRFESPTDGLLTAGARAIRLCLDLAAATARNADGTPPLAYFTPAEGVDPDPDEVVAALNAWKQANRERSTGYVPAALQYNTAGATNKESQMAEALQHAVLEIARLSGLDAEEVGVAVTSRTYQNGESRRQFLIDFTLAPFANAMQDVLSMSHVTPRGYTARFDFDGFLRPDPKSRFEAYEVGMRVGAVTAERIAQAEGLPVESVAADNVRELPAREEAIA